MKRFSILIMASILTGCLGVSGMTPTKQPMSEISKVIEVPNKSKDQIFENSKIWVAQSFRSANNVIQYQDKSTGSIIGKGNIQYPCEGFTDCGAFGADRVNFTIKIDTKDAKARVVISDITRTSLTRIQGAQNINMGKEFPITIIEQQNRIAKKMDEIVDQYKLAITSSQLQNSEW